MTVSVQDCTSTRWDAVVVGTGMGGATTGLELARSGHRVLFIEKGPFLHADFSAAPPGLQQSVVRPEPSGADALARRSSPRLQEGRWPHRLTARTNFGTLNFHPPLGCTSGGSTAFYAAALERFAPADFSPRANFPNAQSSNLPEHWPISYAELEPWYLKAEELFRVRGTSDPLFTGGESALLQPPALSDRDQFLNDDLAAHGLHPYRVHVGCEFIAGCSGCIDGPCPRDCKRDAAWTCLIPALSEHGAKILPDCEVVRLEADADSITGVICRQGDNDVHITARIVVLAAGAFATPSLLLRSRSPDRPNGIGNANDQVGRNLMFHGGDYIAVSPGAALSGEGAQKTLAVNDFYTWQGHKLGTFQTLGVKLAVGQIMQYLRENAELSTAWWRWLLSPRPVWWRKLTSPFVRLGAMIYFYWFNFRDASVWVSILEDLPYRDNRVYPDPDNEQDLVVEYTYTDEMKQRMAVFRDALREVLGNRRLMILSHEDKLDYPHVSGTCRFGDDPRNSVLDKNNKVHDVDNLYVVDASFFPSSGGTNPSLTIAANGLRVAGQIDRVLRAGNAGGSSAVTSQP